LENRNARFFFGPAVRFVKGVKDSSDLGQLVWQEVALAARGRAGDVHEAVGRWERDLDSEGMYLSISIIAREG